MTNAEIDKESLQEELGQIKDAMGLYERYPSMARMWLVEGAGIGGFLPLLQLNERGVFGDYGGLVLIGIWIIGVFVAYSRFVPNYERPTTAPVAVWEHFHATVLLGMGALVVGFLPVIDQLDVSTLTLAYLFFAVVAGLGYVNTGIVLKAYNIRTADRYSFYVGGGWLLALAAVTLWIPFLQEWGLTVLGLSFAIHGVGSYAVLSRL